MNRNFFTKHLNIFDRTSKNVGGQPNFMARLSARHFDRTTKNVGGQLDFMARLSAGQPLIFPYVDRCRVIDPVK